MKWAKDRLEDKSLDCIYATPGSGGFSIANAKSHEDLSRLIAEYPATDLFKWDISPITDFDVQSDLIIRRMNLYIEYANRRKKT